MAWNHAWYGPDAWGGQLLKTLSFVEQESELKSPFPQQLDVVFCSQHPGGSSQTVRSIANQMSDAKWKNALTGSRISDEGIVHIALFLNGQNAPYHLLPVLPEQAEELKKRVLAALRPMASMNGTAVKDAMQHVEKLLKKEGLHV